MRPCPCSLRALETFVKDFAGVGIQRAGPTPFLLGRRAFGNRAALRQFDTSATSPGRGGEAVLSHGRVGLLGKGQTRNLHLAGLGEVGRSDGALAPEAVGHAKAVREEFEAVDDVSLKSEAGMGRRLNRLQRKKRRKEDGSFAKGRDQREGFRERDGAVLVDGQAGEGLEIDESAMEGGTGGVEKVTPTALEAKTEGLKKVSVAVAQKRVEAEKGVQAQSSAPQTRRKRTSEGVKAGKNTSQHNSIQQRRIGVNRSTELKSKTPATKASTTNVEKTAKATHQRRPKDREPWQIQKAALSHKFGEQGWQPNKRLSPDTLEGIRALHVSDPGNYNTETLAQHFHITPEAIRRILKSKWRPNEEEAEARRLRWEKRGVKKWREMAELGIRPPAKWRALGVKTKEQEGRRGNGRQGGRRDEVLWEIGDEAVGVGVGGESFAGRIL